MTEKPPSCLKRIALVGESHAGCSTLAHRFWGACPVFRHTETGGLEAKVEGEPHCTLVLLTPQEDVPWTPERDAKIDAELNRCDVLLIVWAFGSLWFPHACVEEWSRAWHRTHSQDYTRPFPACCPESGLQQEDWPSNAPTLAPLSLRLTGPRYQPIPHRPIFLVGNKSDQCPRFNSLVTKHETNYSTSKDDICAEFWTRPALDDFELRTRDIFQQLPPDPWRLCLSYLLHNEYIDGRTLVVEATYASKKWTTHPRLLFVSAQTGDGFESLRQVVTS